MGYGGGAVGGGGSGQPGSGSFAAIVAALEADWEAEEAAERDAEVADRIRGEQARTSLVQRLRATLGRPVAVGLLAVGAAGERPVLRGILDGTGPDWVLLGGEGELRVGEAVVPLSAVAWVDGLSRRAVEPGTGGVVAERTTVGLLLRRLVRDRAPVLVTLRTGESCAGVLDRVGADHLELALVAAGEPRRTGVVAGVRAVPLAAVAVVRRS